MTETMYSVYARRVGENNWTDWCRVANLERAMEHCENVRRAGFKAKLYDSKNKKVILKDD